MIYIDKEINENVFPKPQDEINPELKNGEWVSNYLQYRYNQYIAGNCGITKEDVDKLLLDRAYMAGKQPVDKYVSTITRESNKTDAQQVSVAKRKAYHNINYENLASPMPKYVRKIEGLFLKQEHSILANATNEKSRVDKLESQIEKHIALKLSSLKKNIQLLGGISDIGDNISKFMERDMDEIQMLSNLGEYKLGYEVASEKSLETTIKLSDYKHIKRKIIRDLICGSIAGMREVVEDNKIKWKYLDPQDAIVPFSDTEHFNNMEYFCYQEKWTIGQLRKMNIFNKDGDNAELGEKKLNELAQTFHKYNHGEKAFAFYQQYYPSSDTYGYDDYVIPILYGAFKSVDTKYRYKFSVAGDERITDGKWGVQKENTIISTKEFIYEGRWIIGTEYNFDCGKLNYIPRNEAGLVRLPAHIVKLDGTSIMDNAKPILDEYALLSYRLQNAWASAVPASFAYDWTALEGIASSSGEKISEFDLIRMHLHGQGMVYRSRPFETNSKYPLADPIKRLEGGLGWTVLQEFITTEEMLDKKLVSAIGIPTIETAGERTPVAVARMAVSSMTDILKPLYDIYIECKERISYNTIYRLQIMLHHDKSGEVRKFYANNIGENFVQYLIEAYEKEPMSFGISFEAMATEEEKNRIKEWAARAASQAGKNGVPILKPSEYMFLTRNIDNPSGIKTFEIVLRHREMQDDLLAQQNQKAMVEAQGEEIQKQIFVAKTLEKVTADAKMEGELDKIVTKGDVDLRNDLTIQGNQQLADAVMLGVNQAIAKYQENGGQQGQPQPPPVPQMQQQTQ